MSISLLTLFTFGWRENKIIKTYHEIYFYLVEVHKVKDQAK